MLFAGVRIARTLILTLGDLLSDIEAEAYGMCGITQATNSVLCWNLYGGYFSPSNQYERLQVPNVQFQSIKLDF